MCSEGGGLCVKQPGKLLSVDHGPNRVYDSSNLVNATEENNWKNSSGGRVCYNRPAGTTADMVEFQRQMK